MSHSHATETAPAGHEPEERVRPSYDDINVPVLVLVGIISTIVTFLSIGFVQGLAYRMENSYLRSATSTNFNLIKSSQAIEAQQALLEGGEGGAVVPIDRAMDLVVTQFGKNGSVGASASHGQAGQADSEPKGPKTPAEGAGH